MAIADPATPFDSRNPIRETSAFMKRELDQKSKDDSTSPKSRQKNGAFFSVEPRETIKACKGSQYFYAGEDANKQQTVASYFFSRWNIGDFRACSRTREAFVVCCDGEGFLRS